MVGLTRSLTRFGCPRNTMVFQRLARSVGNAARNTYQGGSFSVFLHQLSAWAFHTSVCLDVRGGFRGRYARTVADGRTTQGAHSVTDMKALRAQTGRQMPQYLRRREGRAQKPSRCVEIDGLLLFSLLFARDSPNIAGFVRPRGWD